MASTINKQTCAKCSKGGGIAMCNGCQKSFCIKHFVEHRQELSQQMEDIGQEHDLLRRDLEYEKSTHSLLARIDHWEQESIKTIQVAARKARADLQQLLDRTKNELKMSIGKLTEELQICRESDDYTEIDIHKWADQLKDFRQLLESPLIIDIDSDNTTKSSISLIKVSGSQQLLSSAQRLRANENNNRTSEKLVAPETERFDTTYGSITLSKDGLTGWCSSNRWDGSCISGIGRYSSKIHHIRFRIEKMNSRYLFFGIITASQELIGRISESKSAYGWWDLGYTVVNGKGNLTDRIKIISSNDEVSLILDCDNRQIQLRHHRTNNLVGMPVDLGQCPFPWKTILRLDSEHDCVKILQ